MSHVEHDRSLGVPRLKCSRVALSAASPRSFLAAGFPLQSLTRILTTSEPTIRME